ncbi:MULTISPECIES: lytic transglycosylase domain-containing protein [Alphaproteobacteria]|uniref:lytic transglycosylase domain-containing protein n=1 Tax=Alphaproteobacteria TaxID=28211 RepID=UPI000B6221B5|nr:MULTISPECIES: lytic transglycosylase domain-containing protein [unclassified Sphingorhabdus]ASK87141.1 soluble lytic murein transglycosylase [Sphingorhabdus sp. SMR4y]
MAKMLSIGLLTITLCSSVAWAQDVSLQESNGGPTTELGDQQADENSTFQLFQHGIWQPANPLQTIPRTSAVHDDARTNLQKRKLSRLSRTASSRRTIYISSIRAAERKHALPFGLLDALIWQESRYNPMAVSPAGAVGLAQLMPGTASDLGVRNRYDPVANINGGARYLRQMLDKFGGIHLALAAYNAGPNAVQRAKGIPRYRETRDYVKKVLARWTESGL